MTLKDKLKQLPRGPGIYLMIDVLGNIIYVGKAKNLKKRVAQYFGVQKNREPKVAEMIGHIRDFKIIEMDTELDAFIEECRLIKEIKPRYNHQLKSTANYHYLKIGAESYPKLSITQAKEDKGAEYFGPFRGSHYLQKAVEFLQGYYPIRKCSTAGLTHRKNGCLFLQLGSCLGPCTGKISEVDYRRQIDRIKQVLKGEDQAVLTELAKKVEESAVRLEFEQAAKYREYQAALQHIIAKQKMVFASNKNRNILAIEFIDDAHAKLFYIKGNKLLGREIINLSENDEQTLKEHLKLSVESFFDSCKEMPSNRKNKKGETTKNIVISRKNGLSQHEIDEAQIIYGYLKNNKQRILSYWLPASRVKESTPALDVTVDKIIGRIKGGD